jgi:hypothetical protein
VLEGDHAGVAGHRGLQMDRVVGELYSFTIPFSGLGGDILTFFVSEVGKPRVGETSPELTASEVLRLVMSVI